MVYIAVIAFKQDDWSTSYWGSLLSTNLTGGACNIALQYLPKKYRSAFFSNASNPLCGEYLQLTSLYPGRGPCYPVLVETMDYFERCLPKFSSDLLNQLVSASDTSQMILANSTSSVNKYFNTSSQRLQRYIADIQKGFVIIVVAGILGNFGAVGMYVRDQIPLSEDPSAHDRKIWQICAYVAVGLTGLLIIFTLVIIRRVKACPAAHAPPQRT
ncbi:g1779 [Coccomyxa elongata]